MYLLHSLRCLVPIALLSACATNTSIDAGPTTDAARDLDAIAVPDTATPDAVALDIATDTALPDGFARPYCVTCLHERCPSDAVACLADSACMTAVTCMLSCSDVHTASACFDACTHNDPSLLQRAQSLVNCYGSSLPGMCGGPCRYPEYDAGGACIRAGSQCDPLVPWQSTCCDGTCPQGGGHCCRPNGATCSLGVECCGGSCNAMHQCETMTCYPTSVGCLPGGLPCCDTRLRCTSTPAVTLCCAPDGTSVARSEATLCCSGAAYTDVNGATTCVPRGVR